MIRHCHLACAFGKCTAGCAKRGLSLLCVLGSLCISVASATTGDGLPPFHLALVPNPAFDSQQLQIRITRPGCYGILTDEQYAHSMKRDENVIQYTVPIVLGVQPIGCTNSPATFFVSLGQLPANEYDFTLRAVSVHGHWEGAIEVGQLQFVVLPNLANPQPQIVSAGGWAAWLGLSAMLLLVGGFMMATRLGRA